MPDTHRSGPSTLTLAPLCRPDIEPARVAPSSSASQLHKDAAGPSQHTADLARVESPPAAEDHTAGVLPFTLTEDRESDRAVRVALTGELDLASRWPLEDRLGQLARPGVSVRVDLSRLEFIDSSGLHVLIKARQEAHRNGGQLEVEPTLSNQVRRVMALLGIDQLFWPRSRVARDEPRLSP